jgi:hypothetical protein
MARSTVQAERCGGRFTIVAESAPGVPAELLADSLRERADDEIVGIFDEVTHELVGEVPSSVIVFQWRLLR